jgi:hypothetical protein
VLRFARHLKKPSHGAGNGIKQIGADGRPDCRESAPIVGREHPQRGGPRSAFSRESARRGVSEVQRYPVAVAGLEQAWIVGRALRGMK